MALLRCLVAEGVAAVAATPHALDGRYDVSRARMLEGVKRIRCLVEEEGLPLTVHPGAEVMVQPGLPELVRRGEVATLSETGKYVLVEMPFQVVPAEMGRLMFELQLDGIVPVLAHPERTRQVQRNPGILDALVEGGTLIQINASSLAGDLGERAQDTALTLLDRGVAHIVASDTHDKQRRPPRFGVARSCLEARVGEGEAYRMLYERPLCILEGEEMEVPTPSRARVKAAPPVRAAWWRRIFSAP